MTTNPSAADTTRVLFLHHSVGRYILSRGGLRSLLASQLPSAELWDHDYNKFGLSDSDGNPCGRSFPMPDDDTDPPGLLTFLGGLDAGVRDYAHEVLGFDVLVMKSCYPNNSVGKADQHHRLYETYREMHAIAERLPMQVVLATTPPLAPERTNATQRRYARETATWLNEHWTGPNTRVAGVFEALAAPRGRFAGALDWSARRPWPMDSHPGQRGCRRAAEVVAEAIVAAAAARWETPRGKGST